MLNLTCMVLLIGTLVLKNATRAATAAVARTHITSFLLRWSAAVGLLIAGLTARLLLRAEPHAAAAALTRLIDLSLLFALTTMIWALALLLFNVSRHSHQN